MISSKQYHEELRNLENKIIVLFHPFYVAPDGTLLWPSVSNCGCKLRNVIGIQQKNNKVRSKHDRVEVLFESCDEHYIKFMRNVNGDPTKFKEYQDEFIPIGTTDDL